jgi:hypothetical protein
MLGVPIAAAAPAPATAPTGKPPVKSNRTMLGVAMPAGSAGQTPTHPQAQAGAPQPAAAAMGAWGDEEDDVPVRKKGKGGLVAIVLLLILAASGAGVGVWMFLKNSAPDIQVSVVQTDAGEALQIDVPGAAEGTVVRFNAREMPLQTGRAQFALAANDLRIGDNEVHVEIVGPDGSTDQASVVLSVSYRVRADLSALEAEPPKLRIVVDVLPQSAVTLNEVAVPLDSTGHGFVDHDLDSPADAAQYERTFHYRVVPPGGTPAEGDVAVRIPFATLQVDRPGATTVTESARVEVAGSSHPEAKVTLDGTELLLTAEGRFVTTIEIPEVGETEHTLVARQPGRAPRARTFTIRRVADLAAEARAYTVDRSLTYTRIAGNPDTYRGQRAAFEGRVYNVDVHDGQSDLQIVLRECPGSGRCPLWVTFEGATEAGLNDWVRVVGELGGHQQFRAPSGEVMSVPKLDAVFVVPAGE